MWTVTVSFLSLFANQPVEVAKQADTPASVPFHAYLWFFTKTPDKSYLLSISLNSLLWHCLMLCPHIFLALIFLSSTECFAKGSSLTPKIHSPRSTERMVNSNTKVTVSSLKKKKLTKSIFSFHLLPLIQQKPNQFPCLQIKHYCHINFSEAQLWLWSLIRNFDCLFSVYYINSQLFS